MVFAILFVMVRLFSDVNLRLRASFGVAADALGPVRRVFRPVLVITPRRARL